MCFPSVCIPCPGGDEDRGTLLAWAATSHDPPVPRIHPQFPFIVDLLYAFQTDGKLYLILEYLSGVPARFSVDAPEVVCVW